MALAVAAFYALASPLFSFVVLRRRGVPFRAVAELYLPPALIAAAGIGAAHVLWLAVAAYWADAAGSGGGRIAQIAFVGLLGPALYLLLLRTVAPAVLRELADRLRSILRTRGR